MITLYEKLSDSDRFTLTCNELANYYVNSYLKNNEYVGEIPISIAEQIWWVLTNRKEIDVYKFWRLFDNYTDVDDFVSLWSEINPLVLDEFMHTQFDKSKSLSFNNKKLKEWLK
jgi:hypothetical protein